MGNTYYHATAALVLACDQQTFNLDNKVVRWQDLAESFDRISGGKGLDLRTVVIVAAQEGLVEECGGLCRVTEIGQALLNRIWDDQEEEKEARKSAMMGDWDEAEEDQNWSQDAIGDRSEASCCGCYVEDCRGCASA